MKKFLLLIILFFSGCSVPLEETTDQSKSTFAIPPFQEGDIIFQTSRSEQSQAIQLATNSKYSHLGILFKKDGKLYVYEAIQPVQWTPLEQWIERGKKQHYVVKRLKNAKKYLTPDVIKAMKTYALQFKGKDYDVYFDWSDDELYCSELVWKIYKNAVNLEIGQLAQLKDFNLEHIVVQDKMQEKYGHHPPIRKTVISPSTIFESELLETIYFKPKSNMNQNFSSNLDTLQKIINLEQYQPYKVHWHYKKIGIQENSRLAIGPNDYKLEAVLYFDNAMIQQIKNDYTQKTMLIKSNYFEFDWLPQSLQKQLTQYRKISYQPTFFQKYSLRQGYFTILNDEIILLTLATQ